MNWYLVKAERIAEPSALYVQNLGDEGRELSLITATDHGGLLIHLSKLHPALDPMQGESLMISNLRSHHDD